MSCSLFLEKSATFSCTNASSFGRLFRYTVDGQVYAQPLVVSQVAMGDGTVHNVLIVATENDSVYALDANNPTAGPRHNGVLWQDSFINPAKGITPVPFQDEDTNGIFPTSLNQTFTLGPTPLWQGGAASCTAYLQNWDSYARHGTVTTLASTTFPVYA